MPHLGRLPILKTRLNELMGEKSATDFAKELGLSRQTVGFYLNGDRIPDSETLMQICRSCHVSADWLLGLSNEPTPDSTVQGASKYTGLSGYALDRIKELPLSALTIVDQILSHPLWIHAIEQAVYSEALHSRYIEHEASNLTTEEYGEDVRNAIDVLHENFIEDMPYDMASKLYRECSKSTFSAILDQIIECTQIPDRVMKNAVYTQTKNQERPGLL